MKVTIHKGKEMTVTLIIDSKRLHLDNSQLRTSQLVRDVLNAPGQDSIELEIPERYWSVTGIYVDFVQKISFDQEGKVIYPSNLFAVKDLDILLLCFNMESFFADEAFFVYLMNQAYPMWDQFRPYIKTLTDERLIYLYTPYEFVFLTTEKYMDRPTFFKEWLEINANKQVVLNGNEVYIRRLAYYDNGQVEKLKAYHTVKGGEVGFRYEEYWYENGQPLYRHHYKDGQPYGLKEAWYEDGQPKYRVHYKDGQPDGLWEGWHDNGQPHYRHHYKDGKPYGLREAWYENGQAQYRHHYKDGQSDGLKEGWYENGQAQYRGHYKDGLLDGLSGSLVCQWTTFVPRPLQEWSARWSVGKLV